MELYQAVDVWKRISEIQLLRYRCFKNLTTSRYSVQSVDFYQLPLDVAHATSMETQYCELFAEQLPDVRSDSFNSLEEAIAAHDAEFRDA
jgi:hypothetical protein